MSHFYSKVHIDRLDVFVNRLKREIVAESEPLAAEFAATPEPIPYEDREKLPYRPIREGERWGGTWDCGWFRLRGKVPAAWKGAYVTLNLDFGGEALVFDADGCPKVGLTNGSVFDAHYSKDMVHYLPKCRGGETIDLWVETGANGLFGVKLCEDPAWCENPDEVHGSYSACVRRLRVCRFDYEAWQLWLDLSVLQDLVKTLPEGSARKMQVLRCASRALDAYPTGGSAAARAILKEAFALDTDPATLDVHGIGHAHIDTAWLWPMRETVRKVARTFSSQIGLIERYPDYKFGASQAQLYAFAKERYPTL